MVSLQPEGKIMDSVETITVSSLWYAWGMVDSKIHPHLRLDDGWAFSRQRTAVAKAFYVDQSTSHMSSLLNAWADYVKGTERVYQCGQCSADCRWLDYDGGQWVAVSGPEQDRCYDGGRHAVDAAWHERHADIDQD